METGSLESVASADKSGSEDLTFVEDLKGLDPEELSPGLCFGPRGVADKLPQAGAVVESDHPRWSFALAASALAKPRSDWNGECCPITGSEDRR